MHVGGAECDGNVSEQAARSGLCVCESVCVQRKKKEGLHPIGRRVLIERLPAWD